MNQTQRIVLIAYCLLVVYCCVWVPWQFASQPNYLPEGHYLPYRYGYGWLWAGPDRAVGFVGPYATPIFSIIVLRLVAATALGGALFLGVTRR